MSSDEAEESGIGEDVPGAQSGPDRTRSRGESPWAAHAAGSGPRTWLGNTETPCFARYVAPLGIGVAALALPFVRGQRSPAFSSGL